MALFIIKQTLADFMFVVGGWGVEVVVAVN
jgi:hypothetical protein